MISELSYVLGEIARGNLNVSIESELRGDYIALKEALNQIIDSFNEVIGEIGVAADQVAAGSRRCPTAARRYRRALRSRRAPSRSSQQR